MAKWSSKQNIYTIKKCVLMYIFFRNWMEKKIEWFINFVIISWNFLIWLIFLARSIILNFDLLYVIHNCTTKANIIQEKKASKFLTSKSYSKDFMILRQLKMKGGKKRFLNGVFCAPFYEAKARILERYQVFHVT